MRTIVKMRFGSHLYGTNVETSDNDYKGVFVPDPEDIVMQRARKTITSSTKKDQTGKNTADDVDTEQFSLQEYMRLLLEGQTIAIDMLFAPESMILESTAYWDWIVAHRGAFLHKGVSAFIGYCRQQANKYGIKGSRVAAMRSVVDKLKPILEDHPQYKLETLDHTIQELIAANADNQFVKLVDIDGKNGLEKHLEVCNRKVPLKATVKYAYDVYKRVLDQYGHRALAAESNEGVDWKALMHAVRVIKEGKELLSTGKVTFPRPERDLLLQIRKGQLSYNAVADIIEKGFRELEETAAGSELPAEPDYKMADDYVYSVYAGDVYDHVKKEIGE